MIAPARRAELAALFPGIDYKSEFLMLKESLSHMGLSVPALYKQYPDLCEADGAQFASFNVDPAFANCVDGLIVVDTEQIKEKKRRGYLGTEP